MCDYGIFQIKSDMVNHHSYLLYILFLKSKENIQDVDIRQLRTFHLSTHLIATTFNHHLCQPLPCHVPLLDLESALSINLSIRRNRRNKLNTIKASNTNKLCTLYLLPGILLIFSSFTNTI